MRRLIPKGTFAWLPTAVVFAVVALAGSRLIYLSVEHHAAVARQSAAAIAASYAAKIEPPLQRLAAAAREAGSQQQQTFAMAADDTLLSSRPQEAASAGSIASEWKSAEAVRPVAPSAVLGPIRLGSEWFVAVRAPAPAAPGWAVAYANLDSLIADSHLGRLVDMGYDFELAQVEPRSSRVRTIVGSNSDTLADPVAVRIRLPAAAAIPGSYLQVAIRPRSGWYPTTLLASEIGLLAFLSWLLAFGTHDLGHALHRSRAALGAARRRLRAINQQLATEMQQRLNLQETFDHARFHDAFTGLPNRRYFMDQLDRALRDVRTKRRPRIAVVMVDIARFKLVNDMLGHTAGDELMVQAARRFEKSTSPFKVVLARWSGDQFALLLLDIASAEAALNVAELLQEELRTPVELRRHRLVVAAHIGVTCVNSGQQRAEDVVREADIALSVAKRHETARIVPYAPSMAGQAASLVSLEADLHVALERQELRLLFQPIVDLRTQKMVGAEALLRWRHPLESLLAPEQFLSIAEEAGLMVPITRWIIQKVVTLAAEWRRRLSVGEGYFLSINLSPMAVRDPTLSTFVAAQLQAVSLPPSVLKFELTEAALISNVSAARETLEQLHAMGIQLMLDDFGTGYSSLSYLQLFPFDFVKIDRPFVNRSSADQANTGMMAALVQMAGSLKLTAIAEIIETEAAATALREMGCNYGQGYYFSEPIEAESALQRLRSREPFHRDGAPVDDRSPTVTVPVITTIVQPARPKAATGKTRTLEVDDSPTIMLPSGTIDFASDDDEEDDEE